ncbi:hypothetical protein N0V94_007224 [Neodidymelliopsis sp. IMI 364377]|nr:hypothetical protein N0V94_007224 [Neodidymelliopsis sp. IMI 364377]
MRKKVRSGCGTCRTRKVKCDELKPVCKRCHSTGRTCEGYGIWGGGGNGYAERYGGKHTPLHRHPSAAKLNLSDRERECLEWFHHRLVPELSSRLAEGFWPALVMPALLNEPVLAHAVIALSSVHRNAALALDRTHLGSEHVVVEHYNQSLRQLRSAIGFGGNTTVSLALVSCLLYTLLERLRGRFEQAEMHLQSGLRLLKDVHQRLCVNMYGTTLLKRSTSVDPDQVKILQGFASLHLESKLFGTNSPGIDILVQSSEEDVPSRAFRSLEEARYSLNKLVHAILLISRNFLLMAAAEREYRLSRLDIHSQALVLLHAWLKTYKATSFRETKTDYNHQLAYRVLLNHYEMALVMWGHIGCTSESGYASRTANFLAILENTVETLHLLPSLSAAQSTSIGESLATPLFFTALKCRVHTIRLHAVRLLDVISLNQSGWSSTLMVKIATKVMTLEQDASTDRSQCEDFHFTDIPTVGDVETLPGPSSNLIHDIRVGSWDTSANTMSLLCKQSTGDGKVKTVHHYVEISR